MVARYRIKDTQCAIPLSFIANIIKRQLWLYLDIVNNQRGYKIMLKKYELF